MGPLGNWGADITDTLRNLPIPGCRLAFLALHNFFTPSSLLHSFTHIYILYWTDWTAKLRSVEVND